MPAARQRGRIEKLPSGRWSVRCYDEDGVRQRQGGFETKSAAGEWLDRKLDEVAALRRGDRPAAVDIPTVAELVASFLATHEVDPATTDKLRYELQARDPRVRRQADRPASHPRACRMAGHPPGPVAAPAVPLRSGRCSSRPSPGS